MDQLPGEVSGLSNTLGDLQEVRDNTRGLVEETYQSYRATLSTGKQMYSCLGKPSKFVHFAFGTSSRVAI